jgi:hypothetical protein
LQWRGWLVRLATTPLYCGFSSLSWNSLHCVRCPFLPGPADLAFASVPEWYALRVSSRCRNLAARVSTLNKNRTNKDVSCRHIARPHAVPVLFSIFAPLLSSFRIMCDWQAVAAPASVFTHCCMPKCKVEVLGTFHRSRVIPPDLTITATITLSPSRIWLARSHPTVAWRSIPRTHSLLLCEPNLSVIHLPPLPCLIFLLWLVFHLIEPRARAAPRLRASSCVADCHRICANAPIPSMWGSRSSSPLVAARIEQGACRSPSPLWRGSLATGSFGLCWPGELA